VGIEKTTQLDTPMAWLEAVGSKLDGLSSGLMVDGFDCWQLATGLQVFCFVSNDRTLRAFVTLRLVSYCPPRRM